MLQVAVDDSFGQDIFAVDFWRDKATNTSDDEFYLHASTARLIKHVDHIHFLEVIDLDPYKASRPIFCFADFLFDQFIESFDHIELGHQQFLKF